MKQRERRPQRRESRGTEDSQPNPKIVECGDKLKEDIETLIDEIDDVLEENAEEFVKHYVQKGGE